MWTRSAATVKNSIDNIRTSDSINAERHFSLTAFGFCVISESLLGNKHLPTVKILSGNED